MLSFGHAQAEPLTPLSKSEAKKSEAVKSEAAPSSGDSEWLKLKPPEVSTEELNRFFDNLVVVQNRARVKRNHLLFYDYGSFDFSDGPVTFYNIALSFGYAFSDFFEAYASVSPFFFPVKRRINKEVEKIVDIDGKKASLQYSEPKIQYMAQFLWAPAYGKDSWGPYSIVRSDTFFKGGAGVIQFVGGESGMRFDLSVGKTFFFSRLLNVRVSAGGSYLESIVQNQKAFSFVGIFEIGTVWYL
jgi:hypothetical protein